MLEVPMARARSNRRIDLGSLPDRTDRFLKVIKDRPLWVAGYTLFTVSAIFLFHYFSRLPSQYAHFARIGIQVDTNVSEGDKVLKTWDVLRTSFGAAQRAAGHYEATFGGLSARDPVDPAKLSQGLELLCDTRYQLSVGRGTLHGLEFHNVRLQYFKNGFEEDLQRQLALVDKIEAIYLAKSSGDRKRVLQTISDLRGLNPTLQESLSAALSRITSFEGETLSMQRIWMVELSEQMANLTMWQWEFWLAALAILYDAFFIVCALRAYTRQRWQAAGQQSTEGPAG
jgi:hypothetical protein